jgi:hypothetical protein
MKVYDLTASDLPRLKRPESEQRKPVWMVVARHRLTRTFADPLVAPAAHEAPMIEEELQQARFIAALHRRGSEE